MATTTMRLVIAAAAMGLSGTTAPTTTAVRWRAPARDSAPTGFPPLITARHEYVAVGFLRRAVGGEEEVRVDEAA